MRKVKFFLDENWISDRYSYIPLLYDFFGSIVKKNSIFIYKALNKYNFSTKYYDLVDSVDRADFILAPHDYWDLKNKLPSLLQEIIDFAHGKNKPILFYSYGDLSGNIDIPNSYILRTSQYRYKKRDNEIIIPAYTEDILEEYYNHDLHVRPYRKKPVIGFVGWAKLSWRQSIKAIIRNMLFIIAGLFGLKYGALKKGIFFRKQALDILQKSSLIDCNFDIKSSFSGHVETVQGDIDEIRRNFVDNIHNSDYVLCVKGDGNFSNRFYETLSMGRIPLVVDTESVYPLDDEIEYSKFCCIVDFRDIKKIDKILYDFHNNLTDVEFVNIQKEARRYFKEYLRIDNYTKFLMKRLLTFSKDNR